MLRLYTTLIFCSIYIKCGCYFQTIPKNIKVLGLPEKRWDILLNIILALLNHLSSELNMLWLLSPERALNTSPGNGA
jgi:hypothetical protein